MDPEEPNRKRAGRSTSGVRRERAVDGRDRRGSKDPAKPARAQRDGRREAARRQPRESTEGGFGLSKDRAKPARAQRDGRREPALRQPRESTEGGFGPFSRSDDRTAGDRVVRSIAREAVARGSGERSALRLVKRGGDGPSEIHAPKRPRKPPATGSRRPREVATPLARTPREGARTQDALVRASRALERGYEREVVRILRPVAEAHPDAPAVRELLGVALYRLGRWPAAQKELGAFAALTGSCEQHPVLMDCARARGRHAKAAALWQELRDASPGAEVMTEGRIVAAGSLADQGKISEAISLLERGPVSPKRVAEHHLRLWYALADLHERAGDLPSARALFRRVSARDPGFVDVAERLAALS